MGTEALNMSCPLKHMAAAACGLNHRRALAGDPAQRVETQPRRGNRDGTAPFHTT